MPYRIFRAPISNGVGSLQLPTGTVVDFQASGAGNTAVSLTSDAAVMFAPNGSIDSCYANGTRYFVSNTIFLLIGRRERVGNSFVAAPTTADQDRLPNVQDLGNIWVVVNPQTGLIASDVVAASNAAATLPDAIVAARFLARDLQGMGGK
jgi:hypothetical protein